MSRQATARGLQEQSLLCKASVYVHWDISSAAVIVRIIVLCYLIYSVKHLVGYITLILVVLYSIAVSQKDLKLGFSCT